MNIDYTEHSVTVGYLYLIEQLQIKVLPHFRSVLQNFGRLSGKKREQYFSMLTDQEIEKMETIICELMIDS